MSRITFVGVICIVLGGLGILWGVFSLSLPGLPDIPGAVLPEVPEDLLRLRKIMTIAGILVNMIYLAAGVIFMKKTAKSFMFIYSALAIALLYQLVPMLFLDKYSSLPYFHRYKFDLFNFIGPIFNSALLVYVFFIKRSLSKPQKETSSLSKAQLKNINFLIFGFPVMVLSSAFLDVDVIALLAMPILFLSFLLILVFYTGLISKDSNARKFALSFIITGMIIILITAGYAGVLSLDHFREYPRYTGMTFFPSILILLSANILGSVLIFLGLSKSNIIDKKKKVLVWSPSFVIIPAVILVIKLLKLYNLGI